MALTLRDTLLLADVILPAWKRFRDMPRDRPEDVAVFLCHGIIVTHVPASAAADAATPEHRRRWSCSTCRRQFHPQVDRRRDVEACFEKGDVIEAYKIVKGVGSSEGWYDPEGELFGTDLARALGYYAGGYEWGRKMGLAGAL